jgi:hypothetical protein
MAAPAKPKLTFNGKPIEETEATKLLLATYGDKRTPEIFSGLANGTYKCASVAGGYLEIEKPAAVETRK